MKQIEFVSRYLRSVFYNLLYFKSFSKRISFGKNVKIRGNVRLSNNIFLDDNVEIRNGTKDLSFIGAHTAINRNTVIRGKVKIGEHVAIAPNCTIVGFNHVFKDPNMLIGEQGNEVIGIEIESGVWIGANCCVLDGVTIGKGCVVGAGSVVTKSIPEMTVAVGNPCRVIKTRQ